MDRYADQLAASLEAAVQVNYRVSEYRPALGGVSRKLPHLANLQMRYARYVDYPGQARKLNADIFHILDHGYAHLLKVLDPQRTVVTAHDMIPLLAGRGLIPGVTLRRNWLAEYSSSFLRRARKVIADSESTKRDIVRYCGCEPARVAVVHPGLGSQFRCLDEPADELRRRLGVPGSELRLVLITGGQFYKNHAASLEVMRILRQKHGDSIVLVRLGPADAQWRQSLEKSAYRGRVIEFSKLGAEQLAALYNAVDCLLFPSWYEGFGWPPLEAMACGTPAVTSNRASLPEVMGQVGPTFDADDVEAMAAAVETMLFDREQAAAQIERGLRHAAGFQWRETATRVQAIYEAVV